jgi:hypothetical protein
MLIYYPALCGNLFIEMKNIACMEAMFNLLFDEINCKEMANTPVR